ncbi:MAG: DUF58 domain-containing protein [Eubacterium sp.]|nr:DUF58 domain-containing protein [Eubacterium sp.]MCI9411271.1 DUF58 domain-containing protein [Eubacterium sp.]
MLQNLQMGGAGMTFGTLIYFFILLTGLLISVVCLQYGTVAVMGALIIVPVFMLAFLIVMRYHTTVEVECKNPLAEKDSMEKPARATIALSVENNGKFLPISKGIAWVRYENFFSGEKGNMKVRFSVDTGKRRGRRIPVVIHHCGNVSIQVEKVRIYDYLNLFATTIGKNYEVQDVLVMPPLKEIYLGKDRWYNETNEDSDRFSLYKKGDDPSEIFDIRDFKDGDRIQQIHWKLSSKAGHYMVKDGSLPLAKAVHIFLDLCAEDAQTADLLVQGIYSVSMELMAQGVPQHYIWYDSINEIIQEKLIEHEEELFWMFEDLFKCRTTKDPEELIRAYIEWEDGRPKESGLYLTVVDHSESDLDGLGIGELMVLDLRED